jgi:hypothetical protein
MSDTTKKFAVIQRCTDAVFGIGETRAEAIIESVQHLEYEDEDGFKRPCRDASEVESMLTTDRISGALAVIDSDDPEWSDYVK